METAPNLYLITSKPLDLSENESETLMPLAVKSNFWGESQTSGRARKTITGFGWRSLRRFRAVASTDETRSPHQLKVFRFGGGYFTKTRWLT